MTFLEIPHKKYLGVLMINFYGFGCQNDRCPAGYDYQKNYGGTKEQWKASVSGLIQSLTVVQLEGTVLLSSD